MIEKENIDELSGKRGFSFVRTFLRLVILTFFLLIAILGLLVWRLTVDVTVKAQGVIEPKELVKIKPEIPGIIKKVFVRKGQWVKKGALLFCLDDTEARIQLKKIDKEIQAAQAKLRKSKKDLEWIQASLIGKLMEAQANLELAKADLERAQRLYQLSSSVYDKIHRVEKAFRTPLEVKMKKVIVQKMEVQLKAAKASLRQIDAQRSEVKALRNNVEKLKQEKLYYEDMLKKHQIFAPQDGKVLTSGLEKRIGDYVTTGTEILELSPLRDWIVKAFITEENLPKVKPGNRVNLYLKAFPYMEHEIFEGTVEDISLVPGQIIRSSSTPLYLVRIRMDDPDFYSGQQPYPLRSGMSAEVKIVVERQLIARLIWKKLQKTAGKFVKSDLHPID